MGNPSNLLFAAAAGVLANCLTWLNTPAVRTAVLWQLAVGVVLVVLGSWSDRGRCLSGRR